MSIFGVTLKTPDKAKAGSKPGTKSLPAKQTGNRPKGPLPVPTKPEARKPDPEKPLPSPIWPGIISAALLAALHGTGREKMAEGLQMPILLGNVAYAGYWYFSKPKEGGDTTETAQQAGAEAHQAEAAQGPAPTHPDSMYFDLAEKIYQNIRFTSAGNDLGVAKGQFYYLYNATDWNKLYNAFGRREVSDKIIFDTDPIDLPTAIRKKFPTSYISEINELFRKRSINYQI